MLWLSLASCGDHAGPVFQAVPFTPGPCLSRGVDHSIDLALTADRFGRFYPMRMNSYASEHGGNDWLLPEGTPIYAPLDAVVVEASTRRLHGCPDGEYRIGTRARLVGACSRSTCLEVVLEHLSEVWVRKGQRVQAGDPIGLSGRSGCTDFPHLHLGVLALPRRTGSDETEGRPWPRLGRRQAKRVDALPWAATSTSDMLPSTPYGSGGLWSPPTSVQLARRCTGEEYYLGMHDPFALLPLTFEQCAAACEEHLEVGSCAICCEPG